jgi:hypothetical protein
MARRKIIPKSFELAGKEIKVKLSDELYQDWQASGLAKFMTCEIFVQKSNNGVKMAQDFMDQSFCHELAHHLFDAMGERELCADERKTDLLGTFLHSFLKTVKY